MHQIGEDKWRIREIELLKEVHGSEKGEKRRGRGLGVEGWRRENEALTETRERKMNRCADEQK